MLNRFKHLLRSKRSIFSALCQANKLTLDYQSNISELQVLHDIFQDREYADYFPFYRKVTVLDIGAHYGYFSLFAGLNLAPNSRIVAFEPNTSNFKNLQINLQANDLAQVECHPLAIGGKNGEADLFVGKDSNHSIVGNYALSGKTSGGQLVKVRTLEDLMTELKIDHIDFLKMDCEGAEYAIFESIPAHVFDRITTISMEFHDMKDARYTAETLIRTLQNHKFKIVKYVYGPTTMNLNYGRLVGTKESTG